MWLKGSSINSNFFVNAKEAPFTDLWMKARKKTFNKGALKSRHLLILVLLSACSAEPPTGPVETRWDRDNCERCRMVLSEPAYAAQIRYFPPDKRSRVVKFDDFGCAVLWLQQQPWKQDSRTEIWVADHRNNEWINARTATYVDKNNTPMAYGLGAQAETIPGGKNFAQAVSHIAEIEKRHNTHGSHQHPPPAEISQ